MKDKKYLRFLWMLIPMIAGCAFFIVPGFLFSAVVCFFITVITGIYCVLSLTPGRISKILTLVFTTVLLLGILGAAATEIYIISGSHEDSESADYVIVLGAGVNGETPSLMLQNRIDSAYRYLAAHPDTVCVVTGGQGDDENISEAECMYRELTKMGISAQRIWKENQATTTEENIHYSLDLIEEKTGSRPKTAGIISNEFHLFRAKLMASQQGLDPIGIPAETSWVSLKINYYLREIAALWKYLIFGGM